MKKFSKWLIAEAISSSATNSVNNIIQSYLSKKLGSSIYRYPGVEEYKNSTGRGYGIRYFYKNKSIRFNWKGANINAFTLDSVDIWDGSSRDPNWHMEFDGNMSLVKTLPTIVDFAMSPYGQGTFYDIPDDNSSTMKEELFLEAVTKKDPFDTLLSYITPGEPIPIAKIKAEAGVAPLKVLDTLKKETNFFEKQGNKTIFTGTAEDLKNLNPQKDKVIKDSGGVKVKVTKGPSNETYAPNEQEQEIEKKGIAKVAYEEQLKHLSILMKLIIKGTSNALFLAGRGGTGKTQTVEDELHKAGLADGNGYFKNTGSASPVGIYTTLYNNRDSIVLFDDCDSALADQEGRNLIKAATDTKKSRKIAWNKKSSVIIPVADFERAVEAGDGPPTTKDGSPIYPASFEFTGRVIFISNLKLDKLDPDGALRTRGFIIEIDPTDKEMISYMAKIAPNIKIEGGGKLSQSEIDQVLEEIKTSKNKSDISLRKLVRGLNIKAAMGNDPMWKTVLNLYA
jgi:hypothetical protein